MDGNNLLYANGCISFSRCISCGKQLDYITNGYCDNCNNEYFTNNTGNYDIISFDNSDNILHD